MYAKLFGTLIHSTVWREEMHVKVTWITMLAMADEQGYVWASIPGLADAARVSLPQCEEALARFQQPDPYSRTQDHEGRRIEVVEGGWRLLNYGKYRELHDAEHRRAQVREAVRRHRVRRRSGNQDCNQVQSDVIKNKPPKAHTDTNTDPSTTTTCRLPKRQAREYTPGFEEFWATYPGNPNQSKSDAFKAWKARLREGHTAEAIIAGAKRYAAYPVDDPRYRKHAATFLGPGLHFDLPWTSQGGNGGDPLAGVSFG